MVRLVTICAVSALVALGSRALLRPSSGARVDPGEAHPIASHVEPTEPPARCEGSTTAPTASDVEDDLVDLQVLRAALEPPSDLVYHTHDITEVERALDDSAGPARHAAYVDCSEVPCMALFAEADFDAVAASLRRQPGFESTLVGGRGLPETAAGPRAAIVVLWEEVPSPDDRSRAEARLNALATLDRRP